MRAQGGAVFVCLQFKEDASMEAHKCHLAM